MRKTVLLFAPSVAMSVILLNMSFSSQAPEKIWTQPWQDACEETSIVMVDNFYNHRQLDTQSAKREIGNIFAIKEKVFGPSLDESAEDMTYLINNFLNWEASVVENVTMEQIRDQIIQGNPVILPANAKKLNNGYMNASGYHVIVISGYDDSNRTFIAQEPGTAFGKNYAYSYATIDAAIDGNLLNSQGRKRLAIFTNDNLTASIDTDGDKDNLTKLNELDLGTSLISADTNGDGFTDGSAFSRSESFPSKSKATGSELIRLEFDHKVYFVQGNIKRHVVNEAVLRKMGHQMSEVAIIDAESFNSFETGAPIEF